MDGAKFVIVFENLTQEETVALEDALLREQRRRVLAGERSWSIERLLTALWSQLQTQYPPTIPNSPIEVKDEGGELEPPIEPEEPAED